MENELVRRPLPVITSQIGAPTATMFHCITLVALMLKRTFFSVTPQTPENRNNNLTYIKSFGSASRLSGARQILWFLTGVSLDTDTRRPIGEIILRRTKFLIFCAKPKKFVKLCFNTAPTSGPVLSISEDGQGCFHGVIMRKIVRH